MSSLKCCCHKLVHFCYFCSESELKWSLGAVLTSADNQPAPCEVPPFTYPIGPTDRTKGAKTPLEVLKLLLTTVILESIVQQTMLFARQKGFVFQFCIEELLTFIAINVAMGLLRLPVATKKGPKDTKLLSEV